MSVTLYRKYRPKTFDQITGQNHIKVTLQNEFENDQIAHAYLFTGSRGVGKTTMARLFAALINSEKGKDLPSEILEGKDLDVIEIDAASQSKVEEVRENIIENSRYTPYSRKYKVFIIDEVHMLSTSAFNALLKLIEEPPKHAVFILATTELHKVPATIVSRCQRFDFKKINHDQIVERLIWICRQEEVSVDLDVLDTVARLAEGSLRDAESTLGQLMSLGEKNITADVASLILPKTFFNQALDLLKFLIEGKVTESLQLVNQIVDQGGEMVYFTDNFLELTRKLLLVKHGVKAEIAGELTGEQAKELIELSQKIESSRLTQLIDIFMARRLEIKSSLLPQLPLEVGIVIFISSTAPSGGGVVKKKILTTNNPEPIRHSDPALAGEESQNQVDMRSLTAVRDDDRRQDPVMPSLSITIDQIKSKWLQFMQSIQDQQPSLVLILKTSEPLRIDEDALIIGYKYPFHKDRVHGGSLRDLLASKLSDFFGGAIRIIGEVLPNDYVSTFIADQLSNDEVELVADDVVNAQSSLITDTGPVPTNENGSLGDSIINNLVKSFGAKEI